MAIGMKQSMNLSQTLRMTPQLQQAIKLLQLSRLELEASIRSELDENPILEEAHEMNEEDAQRTKEAAQEIEVPTNDNAQDPQKQDEFDWDAYVEQSTKPTSSLTGSGNEEIMNYENVISVTESLYDHLMWQCRMAGFNDEEEVLAEILINYIDEDGYLKTPIDELAASEQVNAQDLLDVLPFVQEFDPPGVGARDLKECLILQAKFLEEDTDDLVYLIQNHLKDLEKKNYEAIAKSMDKHIEVIHEISKIIYSMEPKPGRAFVENDTQYVSPDVYVNKVGDDYVVTLNEEGLPRLKLSNFYKNILKDKDNKGETQDYIQNKLRSAIWLIKSIHQRQRTIHKVAESIVRKQKEFLDKGAAFIKPMILRDVADDIGMHESTVSRVTSNKYIYTPQGIYELKYFFNSGISTSDGESMASESVKLKIKDIVARENPKEPYSDQALVDLLKKEGIQIARRTVAKYREVLRIQPSSQRKKSF